MICRSSRGETDYRKGLPAAAEIRLHHQAHGGLWMVRREGAPLPYFTTLRIEIVDELTPPWLVLWDGASSTTYEPMPYEKRWFRPCDKQGTPIAYSAGPGVQDGG